MREKKLRAVFWIIPVFCVLLLTACGAGEEINAERTVFAMDTIMTLKAYGGNAGKALEEAENEINMLDKKLARGSGDSEIYAVNTLGSAEVSEDTVGLVRAALEICSSTGGAFDISIAPVMDLWGFYKGEYHVPTDKELQEGLAALDYRNVTVNGRRVSVSNGSQIDLGGIAKGYLSSRIIEIMSENGVKSGIISLGGNVQALGRKTDGSSWRVAIQNPDDDKDFIGVVNVSDMAVITSGGYQRFFEQDGRVYHHIINPSDGLPARSGLKSVTVVSGDGTLADGLSTALYVMGLEKGIQYWESHEGFDAVFVTDSDEIFITNGIKDIFESEMDYSVVD